ncbi:MAG: DUF364 domain-containing protein [Candidatus Omnitrophota bacterium]
MNVNYLYDQLKTALREQTAGQQLYHETVSIRCRTLTADQAIGNPEHQDYPIIKGKEVMVEAGFLGAKGQAFTDEFEARDYTITQLIDMELDSNKKRASFIAAFNAVYRYLNLCEKTLHCKDKEPVQCAEELINTIPAGAKVLLIGYQPRFIEKLSSAFQLRTIDMDEDNIGRESFGVIVEPPCRTAEAIDWGNLILATGSTIVNGTIVTFLNSDKPVLFYGITISGPASLLSLKRYCFCGH